MDINTQGGLIGRLVSKIASRTSGPGGPERHQKYKAESVVDYKLTVKVLMVPGLAIFS